MTDRTSPPSPSTPSGGEVARRHLMRALGLGAVALVLPESWTKPIVESVFVPAVAASSGCALQPSTTAAPTTLPL